MPSVGERPESVEIPVIAGLFGAEPLICTGNTSERVLVFPARSVAVAVYGCVLPSASGPTIFNVQAPAALVTAVPAGTPPSNTATIEFASAVPLMANEVALVMPSVDELPVSGLMPDMNGRTGAAVSTRMTSGAEFALRFPAASLAQR